MVSFHSPVSPVQPNPIPDLIKNLSKKRKWDDGDHHNLQFKAEEISEKQPPLRTKGIKSLFGTDLSQLESPLPLEWQRCLDIKSGQIYFYNSRTQRRQTKDPRLSPEPPTDHHHHHAHMSLDLELNLPCGGRYDDDEDKIINHVGDNFSNQSSLDHHHLSSSSTSSTTFSDHHAKLQNSISSPASYNKTTAMTANSISESMMRNSSGGLKRTPSWLTFEGDQQQEMVTAVCKKCHMLVMLCKSCPTCPNCKFLHSADQTQQPDNMFINRRLSSLLC